MNKKETLMNRLDGYCSQLGLDVIPQIVWTKKEFLDMGIEGKGLASATTLGRCCRREKVIYVAYSKHGNLRHLDDTLRHELIHFRFPFLQHGKKFDRLIKELKNGQTWDKFTTNDFEKLDKEKTEKRDKRIADGYYCGHYSFGPKSEFMERGWQFRKFWFYINEVSKK